MHRESVNPGREGEEGDKAVNNWGKGLAYSSERGLKSCKEGWKEISWGEEKDAEKYSILTLLYLSRVKGDPGWLKKITLNFIIVKNLKTCIAVLKDLM
jgi:hypothetical protein